MAIRERLIEYRDGSALLEGFFCHDDSRPGPLPAVLISHTWSGRDEFVERKARRLAWQGFATFALDMYGKGKRGSTTEQCSALMTPFVEDRALLARRITAGLGTLKEQREVDARRIAAMGFCFGGMCVLDLARSGADIRGVVSVHGLLKPNGLRPPAKFHAKVLMLHGYDDPMGPPEDVLAIAKELTAAHADWQLHAYGNTVHAFTNPHANDRANGMAYDETADRRSWHSLLQFLDEVLR
ncbi:MAG TPA: dienelactone hydrolase family protein [Steroidobacteraceae bacterium]|nr:dienelactone hydrolase family protein [Steroidobacteraceae bacterium]